MTPTWLAAGALGAAAILAFALVRTRTRLATLEAGMRRLSQRLDTDLEPAIAEARADARNAATKARDAAIAAGVTEPPPRLPLEPITGRVVRAVAFGAGARRALARATAPPWARSVRQHRRSA
ncbi:MAG: hypothetical protein WEC34_01795 [Acidimicrobiia bacterium]|jgi:hypothetical protein